MYNPSSSGNQQQQQQGQRPQPSGNVIYHKRTSRSYNVHDNVGEETSLENDGYTQQTTLRVNRFMGDRSCELTRVRHNQSGAENVMRSRRGVELHEEEGFEQDWYAAVQRHNLLSLTNNNNNNNNNNRGDDGGIGAHGTGSHDRLQQLRPQQQQQRRQLENSAPRNTGRGRNFPTQQTQPPQRANPATTTTSRYRQGSGNEQRRLAIRDDREHR